MPARSKNVSLGGKTFKVEQKPMRPNKEWRDSLATPVTVLISTIQNYKELENIKSAEDITNMITLVKDVILGSMDFLLDALFDYSPALQQEREFIELNAYDDEAIKALGVVVSLAYPLDQVMTAFRGSAVTPISTSLPLANGASGPKKPLPASRKNT